MTPLQAEMLSNSLAMIGAIIARETLNLDEPEMDLWQHDMAKQMRTAFRTQLTSAKVITHDPRPKQRGPGAQEPRGPKT